MKEKIISSHVRSFLHVRNSILHFFCNPTQNHLRTTSILNVYACAYIGASVHLVDAGKVTKVPVNEATTSLGLADVDQVILKSVVKVIGDDRVTLQQAALDPADLAAALLVNKQPGAQLLRLNLKEASQLLKVHGSVELEVGTDSRVEDGVLDLIHEDGSLVVDGVDVVGRVLEVRRSRADELGARGAEKLLEDGQSLGASTLHAVELLTVLLTDSGVDGVIQTSGVESHTDSDQSVHLVVLLGNGVVVVAALLEVLCAGNVDQNVAEHADGVGVTALHHVGETHVVVGGEVSGHHTGEHGLLVHLDVIEGLQGQAEVTEETVNTQQTDDGEVAQHLVEGAGAVLAGESGGVLTALDGSQLLVDLGTLNERVEHIQNGVAAPCVGVLTEQLSLLLVGSGASDPVAVAAERLELVDELVNDIPGPVVL